MKILMATLKYLIFCIILFYTSYCIAHEAWLLTPNQIVMLNDIPLPHSFSSDNFISIFIAMTMSFLFGVALFAEYCLRDYELLLDSYIRPFAYRYGSLILRLCLGFTLLYASFGNMPRHGIGVIGQPTLFVPDLDLRLIGETGHEWLFLAAIEFAIAILLFLGLFTRLVALSIIILIMMGAYLFGMDAILPYAGHFMMPALFLMCLGSGKYCAFTLDLPRPFDDISYFFNTLDRPSIYRLVLLGTGLNFAFLGVLYKFTQPNLVIQILESSNFPLFGIPVEYVALIMALIETMTGLCLAAGLLVRPLSLFLIGAMCMFAMVLGENLVMHGNIFGLMFIFLLYGRYEKIPVKLMNMNKIPLLKRGIS